MKIFVSIAYKIKLRFNYMIHIQANLISCSENVILIGILSRQFMCLVYFILDLKDSIYIQTE